MTQNVIPPPAQAAIAVQGTDALFPVRRTGASGEIKHRSRTD